MKFTTFVMMIPKIIHYCWFGNKDLNKLGRHCLTTWEHLMPSYRIMRWDESNFDCNMIPFTAEAYRLKKYAFVSDFARFWILYHYGGIYLDTDVELIRPLDAILEHGNFMARESDDEYYGPMINPGLGMAFEKGSHILNDLMDRYHNCPGDGNEPFSLTTVVKVVTEYFKVKGLKAGGEIQKLEDITIYPPEFFCPYDNIHAKLKITGNSVALHHYAASWTPWHRRLKNKIKRELGGIQFCL